MLGRRKTQGLIARLADGPERAFGGQEIRSRGKRRRLVRGCRGGQARDVRDGHPIVPIPRVHVPHAGPDGDLGTSADAGILLEIRSTGDVKVHAKQVRFEFGAACDGCLHVLSAADLGL